MSLRKALALGEDQSHEHPSCSYFQVEASVPQNKDLVEADERSSSLPTVIDETVLEICSAHIDIIPTPSHSTQEKELPRKRRGPSGSRAQIFGRPHRLRHRLPIEAAGTSQWSPQGQQPQRARHQAHPQAELGARDRAAPRQSRAGPGRRFLALGHPAPERGPPLPHEKLSRQYSPSAFSEPPPPPPPRCHSTPPVPPSMQQLMKRMSPSPPLPPARGTSPVQPRQPMVVQNGPQAQQQLSQQIQALSLYQTGAELPPPYPLAGVPPPPPPSYSVSMQNRQSPTQSQDYRKSPSSGGTSAGSPSPVTVAPGAGPGAMTRPTPVQPWTARHAVQAPIIMQSVKSTQVQKSVL